MIMMLNTKLQLPMTFVLQNYHLRFVEPGQDFDPVHIGSKDDVRLNVIAPVKKLSSSIPS